MTGRAIQVARHAIVALSGIGLLVAVVQGLAVGVAVAAFVGAVVAAYGGR